MKKKELPIWFKIETITFLFFSIALGISYFRKANGLNDFDAQYLLTKLLILMAIVGLAWMVSFIICCCHK